MFSSLWNIMRLLPFGFLARNQEFTITLVFSFLFALPPPSTAGRTA
jgi:hypothetical protein